MMTTPSSPLDYLLVGGGLQSGLIALAIRHHQPQARLAIVESSGQLAGNHTWSFHASDLPPTCAAWVEPLIEARWSAYDIFVGGRKRTVQLDYRSSTSAHFSSVVTAALNTPGCEILTNTTAGEVSDRRVAFRNGSHRDAAVVFDNRGPSELDVQHYCGGFQKFWGFELELEHDWPLTRPVVMDDCLDQSDGFRFIYTLPFTRRRVLVEDTRFSNSPTIDRAECLGQVQRYLVAQGCSDWRIAREESGVLPMPTGGALPGSGLPKLAGGYRGGWFHAATGYSFPLAVAVAELVATTPAAELPEALRRLATEHAGRARFARFLNRLLFDLVKPRTRYQIFRRFYQVLDEAQIARFYAHRFTSLDAFRIVVGIPPRGLRPVNFFRSLAAAHHGGAPSNPSTLINGVTS